ncbi:MAG TPA: hypothetical protein VFP84_16780 [Kofleriaceae bacterium]|nr:hypothetical protein [Kofleriaceae bacterium]
MFVLDERIRPDGSLARTRAAWRGDHLALEDDDGTAGALSLVAVDRVMCRYGRPLDPDIALDDESLPCGEYQLRRLRFHAIVDAEARDYLVWQRPDGEPLACLAATAAAALRYLVLRLRTEPTSGN